MQGRGFNRLLLFITIALLSACTSSSRVGEPSPYIASLNESSLYLRGTFNWWGSQNAFQFQLLADNQWKVDVNLIADNTTYDFKIADTNWSPTQNCGALSERLLISGDVSLYCAAQSNNFQFLPKQDGLYRFTIRKESNIYKLSIKQIN